MKLRKKQVVLASMATVMMFGLCGCGGHEDATYCTIYDAESDEETLSALSDYQFLPVDVSDSLTDGLTLEVTLILETSGDYTLDIHYYNADQSDETAEDYIDVMLGVVGSYEKEDDTVTLDASEWGEYSYVSGSTYANDEFSLADDGSTGSWDSEENAELLELVPAATITVDGEAVSSWELE